MSENDREKRDDYIQNIEQKSLKNILMKMFQEGQSTQANIIMDLINATFSIILILQYILSTYDGVPWENDIWGSINLVFHIYFSIEYSIRMYASKNQKQYLQSSESIVDLISLGPYFLIRLYRLQFIREDYEDNWLQLSDLFCLFRLLKSERLIFYMESQVNQQLLSIISSVLTLIVVAAAVVQYVNRFGSAPSPQNTSDTEIYNYKFLYYVYFVISAVSTVGYENVFSSPAQRIVVIVLLSFAIFFVPRKSSQLIQLLSEQSYYARRSYKTTTSISHIVVTGKISSTAAQDFFKELFHEDHGTQTRHAVLLMKAGVDSQIENVTTNPNIIKLQGDPLNEEDLKRAQIEKAKAVIIFCNQQSGDPHADDAKTILQAMVIKKYLQSQNINNMRFCMQLLRHEGKTHYYLSLNTQTRSDQVICIEELKMSLLAQSCLCPGLITVITNLITSSSDPPKKEELANYEWLEDYWKGQGFEIYKANLASVFRGQSFSYVAQQIYKTFQAILFGLEVITDTDSQIYLNPGSYIIPSYNSQIVGYIISQDQTVADDISNYQANEYDSLLKRRRTLAEGPLPARLNTLTNLKDDNNQATPKNQSSLAKIIPFKFRKTMSMFQQQPQKSEEPPIEDQDTEDDDEASENGKFNAQSEFQNILASDTLRINDQSYVTRERINIKDITFQTLENNILAVDHIILCGMVPNLINFVLPLRAKYLGTYFTIVILNTEQPTEKQWNQISIFPQIYFIKGSALKERDLVRANIMKAKQVVILSPSVAEITEQRQKSESNDELSISKEEEDLLDARTIFKYKAVQRHNPDIRIVTQLVNPQNIAFLLSNPKDYALMRKHGYNHSPLFASGEIYISSMMDSLCCQAYYNSALITVLNLLLVGTDYNTQNDQDGGKSSNLFHLRVPFACVGESFQQLFKYLCQQQNIIVIGLYRLPGCQDNKLPYVWTNPDPDTIITEKDTLLVLATEKPNQNFMQWGGPLETQNKEMEEQKSNKVYPFGVNNRGTTANGEDQNTNMLILAKDYDRENQKNKMLIKESQMVQDRVNEIIEKIEDLKNDTEQLRQIMINREETICQNLKEIFSDNISELFQMKNSEHRVDENGDLTSSDVDEEFGVSEQMQLKSSKN